MMVALAILWIDCGALRCSMAFVFRVAFLCAVFQVSCIEFRVSNTVFLCFHVLGVVILVKWAIMFSVYVLK